MNDITKPFIRQVKDISVGISFFTLISTSLVESVFAQSDSLSQINISNQTYKDSLNNLGDNTGRVVHISEIQPKIFKIQSETMIDKMLESYVTVLYLNGKRDTLNLQEAENIIELYISTPKKDEHYDANYDFSLGKVLLISTFSIVVNKKLWNYRRDQQYWNETDRYYGKEKVIYPKKTKNIPETSSGYFKYSNRSASS